MSVTYHFAFFFTDKTTGAGIIPSPVPTVNILNTSNSLVVSGGTLTAYSNQAGYYTYDYATSTPNNYIGFANTSDSSVVAQTLGSYPQVLLDANGNVLADVQTNADKTDYVLSAGEHTNMVTDTQTGLTAQGYTPTRAGYLDKLNSFLDAPVSGVNTTLATVVARLGAFTGTGVNTVLGFFLAALRKDATLPSNVGGTFTPTTDSLEAVREKADTLAPGTPQVVQLAATITEDHTP